MFLVTTADQRYWNKDKKILFLGEWCKYYSERSAWPRLSHETLPYHWDNREKLFQDYLYINDLSEKYLKILAENLNKFHGVNHSEKYWRILIGPWLNLFISVLFDRYTSIKLAVDSGKVTNTWISLSGLDSFIAKDLITASEWYRTNEWNHFLYSWIIKNSGQIPFEIIENPAHLSQLETNNIFTSSSHAKNSAKRLLEFASKCVPDSANKIVIVSPGFDLPSLGKLQLSLNQLPYLYPSKIKITQSSINIKSRKEIGLDGSQDEFEDLLNKLIPLQIPSVYVEDYLNTHRKSIQIFPKDPEVIVTGTGHFFDEGFKFWAAHQNERGKKLSLLQYGGGAGISRWSVIIDHDLAISDKYFSWGWAEENVSKIAPMPSIALEKNKQLYKPDFKGKILCVTTTVPRFSYWMYTNFVAPQILQYIEGLKNLLKLVSPEVYKLFTLRLHPVDMGWCEADRWRDFDPSLDLSLGKQPMHKELAQSQLCICTYNGTTYLETLAANFPTLIFWDPHFNELKDSAIPAHDKLHRAGILHYTPESAANKLNEVCQDTRKWWTSPEVQTARNDFCNQFARTSDNWLAEWRKELKNLSSLNAL
jgi:putative transferase (TIGR04331 family)